MLEEPVVLGREELVEVERVVDVRLVLVDRHALGKTVGDHPRDLVGQQVERRQRGVRVLLAIVLPLLAGGLLVLVCPVEDLVLAANLPEASALNGVPDRCSVHVRLIWSNATSVFVVSMPSWASSITRRSHSKSAMCLSLW